MVAPGADPNNDMAWFSLGGAYAQAGRHSDAAKAYLRCTELNADMSKAFQLAGQAFVDGGDPAKAAQVLTQGFQVASRRGDRMPAKAMADLLTKLGQPVPEIAVPAAATGPVPDGAFIDGKTGRPGTKMSRPPFKGPVGLWIAENISKETFDAWIKQGTKVINEMRLDLSREQDEQTYDRHMRDFLGIDDELLAKLTAPKY